MSTTVLRQGRRLCRIIRDSRKLIHNDLKEGSRAAYTSHACLAERQSAFLLATQTNLRGSQPCPEHRSQHSGFQSLFQGQQQCRQAGAATQPVPSDDDIILTDNAIEKLHELCKGQGESCLRLTVEAGGCSGFSYKFNLDSTINEGDKVFEASGVKLVADSMSYEFVRGSKVDYSQELIKSSFEVLDNPNADKGCGCGTSFSPK